MENLFKSPDPLATLQKVMEKATFMGYRDASMNLPVKTGEQIIQLLCSNWYLGHIPLLKSAYSAGKFQWELSAKG